MRITTSRFGAIDLTEEDLIHFPEGLLGFNDLRNFVLLDDPNDEIFAWLQSCENGQIAFPVLEPELFVSNYKPTLSKSDFEVLQMVATDPMRYFAIVTIPQDPTQMTANLKAPLVINLKKRTGRQCVLQDNNLAIREPIFTRLQQRVVANPSVSIKSQLGDLEELGVRLPAEADNRGPEVKR